MTKAASSATFHGWKDVDLIVRSNVVEEDDDLNEGFCHFSLHFLYLMSRRERNPSKQKSPDFFYFLTAFQF